MNPTQTPNRQDDDNGLNPSARDAHETLNRPSQNNLRDAEKNPSAPGTEAANDKQPSVAEKAATGAAAMAADRFTPGAGRAVKYLAKLKTKKGGVAGLMIGALIGLFVIGGFFLGGFLAPIAFFENVTDDLNDQLAAMDTRQGYMMRNKVSISDRGAALNGCTKLSIRCKFKTLSSAQVAKLNRAGIQVAGVNGGVFGNRTRPTAYTYNDRSYNPSQFADAIGNDPSVRTAFKTALNMKYLGFSDSRFVNWSMKKLGISKKAPALSGTREERFRALANNTSADSAKKLSFTNIAAEGEEPRYVVDGGNPTQTYSEAERNRQLAAFDRVSGATKPPSRLGSNAIKGLSVLGTYDLACTVNNMVGMATVAAKVAHNYELAQYAMPVASLAHKAKAGDISSQDGEALGEFFSNPDNRKTVVDLENSFNEQDSTQFTLKDGELPTKQNPYYGKTVMDSSLYKLSSTGTMGAMSPANSQYSLGLGQSSLLSGFASAAAATDTILNVGPGCGFVQNWFVRGVGLIGGVALAFGSGGGSLAVQAGIFVAFFGAIIVLDSVINNALSGSMLSEDMEAVPEERATATWTGMAAITGESARSRGMMPGNSAQIADYARVQTSSRQDYIAVENQDRSPFDMTTSYSFAGRVAIYISSFKPTSASIGSYIHAISSFVINTLSLAVKSPTASAQTFDESRFQKCDDEAYREMNIDADVQCNVRYVMSDTDLEMDTDVTAAYMENNGYVERETSTGLPKGYTPPDPEASRNFSLDMLRGVANSFYNTRSFGDTDNGYKDDYGKFLDYCAYRSFPFGKTFEETGALGSAEEGWKTGEFCMRAGLPYSAFRIYTMDITVNDAAEEVVDTASGSPDTSTATASGEVAELAQQILDLRAAGKIVIADFSTSPDFDRRERTLASQQLEDIAAGKPVGLTTRCNFQLTRPIVPDAKILQFLVDLGGTYKYTITSLFGQCHSRTSNHYDGKAVDFGCPFDTSAGDRVGEKYGVSRNFETCSGERHYHYSVGGR